jgi:cobalt-zinc-cadmium efflux system outer membrane protein
MVWFPKCACLAACVVLIAPAFAAEAPLTFRDAIGRSLERNPELAAQASELAAQDGRIQQAGARSNVELGLLVENALGSGARSGFDAAETTLSIGFLLDGQTRRRQRDAAVASRAVLTTEQQIRRLDVAAETARRYIGILAVQQQLEELRGARILTEQTLAAVQARVRAAKVPEAEEARAQARLARAVLEEGHADHQLLTARRKLSALWGESSADFGAVSGELSRLSKLPAYEVLRARLDGNVDAERFVSEQRLREAELRVAQARRTPPWQVSAGVRRFELESDQAVVVGLTIPFASRRSSDGGIAAARAQLEAINAKKDALRVRLDVELFALYQDLNHSYVEVTTLRDEVLPKMQKAADESRYAYERGRYSYVEYAAAQAELLELRQALLEAYAQAHQFRIEIERLTGTSLEGDLP